MARVYLNSNATNNIISSNDTLAFYAPSGMLQAGHNGARSTVIDSQAIPLNTWTFVVVSYDVVSQTMALYKNTSMVSSATSVAAPSGNSSTVI